jgi:FdhE protein
VAPIADDRWSARIARARQLASTTEAAADLLTFSAGLAERQRTLRGVSDAGSRPAAITLSAALDRDAVVAAIPELIGWLMEQTPHALASAASSMRAVASHEWRQRLDTWLDGDTADDPHIAFVVEATVQPFAEIAAAAKIDGADPMPSPSACQFCYRSASFATLREAGHGARRSLQCGLCLSQWPIPRIGCAACGETAFERLPVFSAETFPQARIDACDGCHGYLKTIDFTRDGLAVPIADDLATLPLDLWAQEQGYRRWRPHLFGV